MKTKSGKAYRSLPGLLAGALLLTLCMADGLSAQTRFKAFDSREIDAGTTITVRTTQRIEADDDDGRVFGGVVDRDVLNRNGSVAIPRGSDVELMVREISDNQVALDIEAVTINQQRFTVQTDENIIESERREGLGINKRTGKYVGGGALIGGVIGAIAGGGKGAAIGAGAGAAAGAGAQVLTRGRSVKVPAESLLTFRLQQPMQSNGARLTPAQGVYSNSAAYRDGQRAGRSDASRSLTRNLRTTRWTTYQQRRDYEAGYNRGYDEYYGRYNDPYENDPYNDPYDDDRYEYNTASITIGRDNRVVWYAPAGSRLYVQTDNNLPQLMAEGTSGSELASWIRNGHRYVFFLEDLRGNQIAREVLDLRRR